jgi:hypothetical protein
VSDAASPGTWFFDRLNDFFGNFSGGHRPSRRDRARVPFGRVVGNVDGVLNGASTAFDTVEVSGSNPLVPTIYFKYLQ